jgi:hypothetical protein
MEPRPNQNAPGNPPMSFEQAAFVRALEHRCQSLKARHTERKHQRALLSAQIEELIEARDALDLEIAGIEGHGAEAEQWLSLVKESQPPPRPRLVPDPPPAGPAEETITEEPPQE